MEDPTIQLIEEVREIYKPIIIGDGSKVQRGEDLWEQFESAVTAYEDKKASSERQIFERINEMAAAKALVEDQSLVGTIYYEPELLKSGRKIDFVTERENDNHYVEVKTVHPETPDNEKTWERYQELRKFHPKDVNFVVQEEWMGGMVYGNTFASRSKFLDYTMVFEERLQEAQTVRPGPGILIFCGSGFQWNLSDLEDFADFYFTGKHRADDPFALMEQYEMDEQGFELVRNISYFGFLKRQKFMATNERLHFPVRGPLIGK